MKLYTEKQVKQMLINMDEFTLLHINRLMDEMTPIELPSDEEINEQAKGHSTFAPSFIYGVEWMRDKIQGGNK
jgi:hypothetical protein